MLEAFKLIDLDHDHNQEHVQQSFAVLKQSTEWACQRVQSLWQSDYKGEHPSLYRLSCPFRLPIHMDELLCQVP